MDMWFLLYLILKLDAVVILFVVGAILFGGTGFIFGLHGATLMSHDYNYDKERVAAAKESFFKKAKKYGSISAVFVVIAVLVPSTKDIVMITGGVGVLEAARTEQAKTIASKSVQVVEKFLDRYLQEEAKNSEGKK